MTTTAEVVDGTVVEDHAPTPTPSTLPIRRERRSEVIRPLGAQELVDSFAEYQSLLPKLLDASDWQDAGRGETFVKKSGWRKIATAFDLDVQIIGSTVERAANGSPLRAEVIARAIAPSGRAMDGDGYCAVDEKRFAKEAARGKLENDLRATATTRAMNRAISNLVGMGAVSAEEIDTDAQAGPPVPAWAVGASPEQWKDLGQSWQDLAVMLGVHDDVARDAWRRLVQPFAGARPAGFVTGLTAAIRAFDAAGSAGPTELPA